MDTPIDVDCPHCGLKHTLQDSDIGASLACSDCGGAFKYDEPLRQAKKEAKRLAKEQQAEAKHRASVDEAEAQQKEEQAEGDRVQAWAEFQRRQAEDQQREALQQAAERTASPEGRKREWERIWRERGVRDYLEHPSYEGIRVCAVVAGIVGWVGVAISVIAFCIVMNERVDSKIGAPPLGLVFTVVVGSLFGSFFWIAASYVLQALRNNAINLDRITRLLEKSNESDNDHA